MTVTSLLRRASRFVKRPPSPPRRFSQPNAGFDYPKPMEEEQFIHYSPSLFRPVQVGEILHERYQIVGKLGYGSNSTVWLCRDLDGHRYVTVKIGNDKSPEREVHAYEYLKTVRAKHRGRSLIRTMEDHFILANGSARYPCLVHKPLSINMRQLRRKLEDQRLPVYLWRPALVHILLALDFLHTEARMVHTDLQEKNIILGLEDDSVLKAFEEDEREHPSPRKIREDRDVYLTRLIRMPEKHGDPILTDFGEARWGKEEYDDDIQPFQYRAPEVIFGIPWTEKVDIWNVGVLMWDMFQSKNLFEVVDSNGEDSTPHHVAHMIALLGHPPKDFLAKSPQIKDFFNREGKWIGTDSIPDASLESSEENLDGEAKTQFLAFVRRMLTWNAADRPSAGELLQDPWIRQRIQA